MISEAKSEWRLAIPKYEDGVLDETLYSCGYAYRETGEKSLMHIISETTARKFTEYCLALENDGYECTFKNEMDGNLYAAYTDENGRRWYAYYLTADGKSGTVRIMSECPESATLDDFCYTADGEGEFYVFNLNTDADDTYLVHLCDGKWVVIDGATTGFGAIDPEREFSDWLFDFMRERSEGEKVVIAAWYLTHAHRDHFQAFGGLVDKHYGDIALERIIANVPDGDVVDHNTNMPHFKACMDSIRERFPNLKYLKAHTGMRIDLANLSVTVLYTQEDHLDFWVANREPFYALWRNYPKMDKNDPNYEEYRQSYKVYDINNTSLNAIFELDGMRILELGDGFRWHELMAPYYSRDTLLCDIVKAAHHFNNEETVHIYCEMCESGRDMYILIPSREIKLEKNEKRIMSALRANQICLLGSCDTVRGFKADGSKIVKTDIPARFSWHNVAEQSK